MDSGPFRLRARPTSLVVEAPTVKPTLMPETVNGYFLPRNSRTPSPPPTPTMNPPLVKTTATWPVSARDGVVTPATPRNRAASAKRVANFLMMSFLRNWNMRRPPIGESSLQCELGVVVLPQILATALLD